MAMNKAEQAALEKVLTLAAFYRTQSVERDLIPPTAGVGNLSLIKGWDFNVHSPRVEKACSTSISHDFGSWNRTTTQQPRNLYSTKLLALRAMRHAIEQEVCVKLRAVDRMIEAELANPTPGPDSA